MHYTRWDTRSTNVIAGYDNERDALLVVLNGIELNGPDDTDTRVLEVEDETGELISSVQGTELADLAHRTLQPEQTIR